MCDEIKQNESEVDSGMLLVSKVLCKCHFGIKSDRRKKNRCVRSDGSINLYVIAVELYIVKSYLNVACVLYKYVRVYISKVFLFLD